MQVHSSPPMSSFQKIPLWKGKGCKYLKWGFLCCLLGMVCIVQLPGHTVSGSLLWTMPYKLLLHVHRRDCWVYPRWLAQRVKGQMVSLAAVLQVRLSSETDPVLSISGCWILHYFSFSFIFFYVYGYSTCMYVCGPCDCSVPWDQEKALNPLVLELQMNVSSHLGTGNRNQVLCKNSQLLNDGAFSPDLIPCYFWTAESAQKHRVEIKETFFVMILTESAVSGLQTDKMDTCLWHTVPEWGMSPSLASIQTPKGLQYPITQELH